MGSTGGSKSGGGIEIYSDDKKEAKYKATKKVIAQTRVA